MNPTVTKSVDGFLTQEMAKIGHRTLTKGQSNKITDQFSTELFSVKEVIKKKIEIFKTEIERFYWRDEWGFSTKDCLTEISSLYKEVLIDLKHIIGLEDLKGETDWEEINELIETVMELKSENMYIFKKEKYGNHDNHEDRKEAPNLGKHKINEAPKISSDDKEEMISNYKTLKCSKCSHKIIIKNKNLKINPWSN